MKQLYTLLFCLLISLHLHAQELAQKSTFKNNISEKYLVLKKDKSVKHGQYLRIYNSPLKETFMMELGQYNNNQKAGTWITFYHNNATNSIQSVGDYLNGEKEGAWSNYHELFEHHLITRARQGTVKRTRIIPPAKGALEHVVEVNAENHILESTGHYANGNKVGIWEYYDKLGNLSQSYNHTTGELLEDRTEKPENAFLTYLGGMNRFRVLFFSAQRALPPFFQRITQSSEAVFELEKDGNFRFVSVVGDAYLKEHAEQVLQSMPKEWIYAETDAADKAKLHVSLRAVKGEERMTSYSFYIDFKAVE